MQKLIKHSLETFAALLCMYYVCIMYVMILTHIITLPKEYVVIFVGKRDNPLGVFFGNRKQVFQNTLYLQIYIK